MEYIAECLNKFQDLPSAIKEKLGSGTYYLKMKELEDKYKISLSFVLILLAIGELEPEDVPEYLKAKFNLTKKEAQAVANSLVEDVFFAAIEKQIAESTPDLSKKPITETSIIENFFSREQIENIFSSGLIAMFSRPKKEIEIFNQSVFFEIDKDESLEDKLIDRLLNNNELLSKNNILIDNKPKPGTIANWLKDFIAKNGSDIFDGLVLAKYMSNDKAVAELDPLEKSNLNKLLKTYRNFVFFPDSMNGVPISQWSIIPLEDPFTVNHVDNVKREKTISTIQPEVSLENVSRNNNSNFYYLQLQKMLLNYSPNSLEYKAIKDEMNKLEKK